MKDIILLIAAIGLLAMGLCLWRKIEQEHRQCAPGTARAVSGDVWVCVENNLWWGR